MRLSELLTKVKKTVFPETWCVAIRFNNGSNILEDTESPFTVLPNTKYLWCADPFLFEKDGQYYVFFEVLDQLKRKGMIGYRTINNDSFGDIKIIYEDEYHLSFPFIYEENGEIYIIPESSHSKQLFRLKCLEFPDKWEKETVLIEDTLVDTVLFDFQGVRYYISEKIINENVFDRVDLFFEDNGVLKESADNPVKTDLKSARSAGKVFEFNGDLIRPSQDCSTSYGEKLVFNKITELNPNNLCEEFFKQISVSDININDGKTYNGIHTYNSLSNYEVVDLKIPSCFSFNNTVGAIKKLFRG